MARRTRRGNVLIIDRGLDRILKMLRRGDGGRTTIGIQGAEASQERDGINNAGLAAVHEFGAPSVGVPERSFMRAPFDQGMRRRRGVAGKFAPGYIGLIASGLDEAMDGKKTVAQVLNGVGELVRADMIRAIDSGIAPPLKAATIARKGSSKQLIDTGVLKSSITVKTTG